MFVRRKRGRHDILGDFHWAEVLSYSLNGRLCVAAFFGEVSFQRFQVEYLGFDGGGLLLTGCYCSVNERLGLISEEGEGGELSLE